MKKKFIKPNWYPSADIIANRQGWIYTKNHNEVLSAIARLDTRIAAEEALNIQPMIVIPSSSTISISSASDLEIDWGDGTIQTVKSGDDDTILEQLGLISNKYTHTYTDSYIDKQISIKHIDGASPIQFFSSDAIKTVQRWYSKGYQPSRIINESAHLYHDMTFFGLGPLETVPNIAPPNTTDLSGLFYNASTFNQDISGWDVSNVTSLANTFTYALSFNQDISGWDVSNVTSLVYTFTYAVAFNQPIGAWNVSKVTTLYQTFNTAMAFNQPLDQWDVSNVTDMTGTFGNTKTFNQPLNTWNTGNVTTMQRMFSATKTFNQDISAWNTSNVTDMAGMFVEASAFDQNLSQWCVPLIASLPSSFATDAVLFTPDKFPVWGTCPRGENLVI